MSLRRRGREREVIGLIERRRFRGAREEEDMDEDERRRKKV